MKTEIKENPAGIGNKILLVHRSTLAFILPNLLKYCVALGLEPRITLHLCSLAAVALLSCPGPISTGLPFSGRPSSIQSLSCKPTHLRCPVAQMVFHTHLSNGFLCTVALLLL